MRHSVKQSGVITKDLKKYSSIEDYFEKSQVVFISSHISEMYVIIQCISDVTPLPFYIELFHILSVSLSLYYSQVVGFKIASIFSFCLYLAGRILIVFIFNYNFLRTKRFLFAHKSDRTSKACKLYLYVCDNVVNGRS